MIAQLISKGVVKPKMAFALLKNEVEKQAGEKLKAFNIRHIVDLEKMVVDIQRVSSDKIERYSYEEKGNTLAKIISAFSKKDIENGTLNGFDIFFGDSSYLRVYFTDENNEKQIKHIEL